MSTIILPPRLRPGDQVALIAPAFRATEEKMNEAVARVEALNLKAVNMAAELQNDGYFAASTPHIVAQLHAAFANPAIKAIISMRGGYGCARLLPHLDWRLIQENPKIVLGFSDLTALLIAIRERTGLVTFHGPSATMEWPTFTQDYLKRILFTGESICFAPPNGNLLPMTLNPGSATGELIGGNLSVLTSLIGSPYLPQNWRDKILFLEDVREEIYRIDRMLTQLKLAGILSQIKGLVFGQFNHCTSRTPHSFTLEEVLFRAAQDLKIPIYANAAFGHQPHMFTFPIGALAHLDADQGTLKLTGAVVR